MRSTCDPSAAYNKAYSHVSGKCASYHEIMLRAESNGIQNLVSTLLPTSIEEAAQVRGLPPTRIIRANNHSD